MLSSRLKAALLCGVLLLSVVSCSDPASVGMNVGPDSLAGGDPEVKELVPSSLDTTVVPSRTGFVPDSSLTPSQLRTWRVLTGVVTDPIAGTVEADGYIDFYGTANRPSGFSNVIADSLNAELQLRRSYLHGDTSQTLEVHLYDLARNADMSRAPSDTVFAADPQPIQSETFTVSPRDTLISLSLPSSWIQEHQTSIQNSDPFDDGRFDGFKITTTSGGSVIGFEHGSARLQVTTSTDTVDFRAEKTFTHLERVSGPSQPLPNDMLLMQDGLGVRLTMAWGSNSVIDSLARNNVLLNRAELTVPVDTTYRMPGNSFVRPAPAGYRLLGSRVSEGPTCGELRLFSLSQTGETCVFPTVQGWAPEAARVVTESAFAVFDRWFFDAAPLSSFSAEIANRAIADPSEQESALRGIPSTTPVVVRTSGSNPNQLPRATLTVTGLGAQSE